MKNRFLQFFIAILIVLFFGCSTSSDGNGNSTTDVVPVAPSNLSGSAVSTSQINLSWTDNSTNETGFKIERKSGTGIFTVVGTTSSNVSTFSDTGVLPITNYIYRVYSYNTFGNSINYSNELQITTGNSTSLNVPGPNVTDIDGNMYQSITNCSQTWLQSNLNVSKYSDGTSIPQVTDPTQWANLTTGAWCYYGNSLNFGVIYGKLYNWYAVAGIYNAASEANPSLRKKLAPVGWHIPTHAEWNYLSNCLGGETVAGGKMKATGPSLWNSPNLAATNESGFTGLPGGFRTGASSAFQSVSYCGYWWSSSESSPTNIWYRYLDNGDGSLHKEDYYKDFGRSVRCVRD